MPSSARTLMKMSSVDGGACGARRHEGGEAQGGQRRQRWCQAINGLLGFEQTDSVVGSEEWVGQ